MRKLNLFFAFTAAMVMSIQANAQWSNSGNNLTTGTLRVGPSIAFTTKQLVVKATGFDHVALFENTNSFGNGMIISAAYDPLRVGGLNNQAGNLLRVQTNGITSLGHAVAPTTNLWRLNVNGSAISSGWITSSDRRLKKDIHEDFSHHNKLYQIKTYDYKYKSDADNNLQFGVMAQEMKEIYPNLVSGSEEDGYGVNYTAMIPLLIRAVQDQKQTIESLQEELTDLKSKITENGEMAELLDLEGDKMTIFPNPSNSVANISLKGTNRGSVSLEVINLNGEVVQRIANANSKSAEINTSEMLKGVYFVRYIRDGKVLETKRLLIEK